MSSGKGKLYVFEPSMLPGQTPMSETQLFDGLVITGLTEGDVLYGTAQAFDSIGPVTTVFALNANGEKEDLAAFAGGVGASLLQASDGKLYIPMTDGRVVRVTPNIPALQNASTRMEVGIGDSVLIGGVIITGTSDATVVFRAIGPSLTLGGSLEDPVLELRDFAGKLIAVNNNWQDGENANAIIESGLAPVNPAEAAIYATLSPGAYTTIVRGVGNTTGVALVEAYNLNHDDTLLANISTRGNVQGGDKAMIGGIIVSGANDASVVFRAIGPSLADAGVPNSLSDPKLDIYNDDGMVVASNDNWMDDVNADKVMESGLAPVNPAESAIYATLAPGAYTAIVRGADNATGVALIEAYNLP